MTRRNLEWPPITASRNVVFARFVCGVSMRSKTLKGKSQGNTMPIKILEIPEVNRGKHRSPPRGNLPKRIRKETTTPVPSWTDSLLKALRSRQDSSCHLFSQHSPVTRRNLEWPPIMASRHVVFAHFVLFFEEQTARCNSDLMLAIFSPLVYLAGKHLYADGNNEL